MANQPLPKAHELYSVIQSLEIQLKRLDEIGSGLAAVHVNAAIEQLHANLAIVNDNDHGAFDPALLCLVPDHIERARGLFRSTRD
uniref:hypothetical protein n=1 Tax=uncultured Erythrobacter sp. TaxID=263913 RepID=UPI00262DCD55|nr:hypothetical protein [uncultured Erythrobacter sp.]